eukprot:TRINITY_DN92145_c0_g1_i1.p1 TRINITY_DN92145_c0_g1~~TRINITY_DN92145_c0_g1_i1.p1  ORF type:complete len:298 (-),score=42.72 TRINITY_DN92145_c0_g1_i1:210-1103(-)
MARFPEGGALDRLDKRCSSPMFTCTLPGPIEVLLTIPGAWFGCPLYATCLVPLLVAAAAPGSPQSLQLFVAPVSVAGLCYWLRLCQESASTGHGLMKAYTCCGKLALLLLSNTAIAMTQWLGHEESAEAAATYLSSWLCSQLLIEVLKGLAWRRRPIAALPELAKVPRTVGDFRDLVSQPSQAYLSLPSGDAAGGAIFATTMMAAAPAPLRLVGVVTGGLSSVGRMYFQCHHLLDVLCGDAIGCAVTLLLRRLCAPSWLHVVFSQLLLISLWKPAQLLKPRGAKTQDLDATSLRFDK